MRSSTGAPRPRLGPELPLSLMGGPTPSPGTNGGLWWNGTRFSQSWTRLPVDQRGDLERLQRIAERGTARGSVGQLAPAAVEHGCHRRAAGLVAHVDARPDLVAGLRERVLVALVEAEERRDVQMLVVRVPERRAAQQLGHALAEGVADLGDHAGQLPVGPVAPVERDRVEDVAEHAQLREHQDAASRSGRR